jgi:hypothetical protein
MVNKHIRAIFLFNETIPFFLIEPFHGTICHSDVLLFCLSYRSSRSGRHYARIHCRQKNCRSLFSVEQWCRA